MGGVFTICTNSAVTFHAGACVFLPAVVEPRPGAVGGPPSNTSASRHRGRQQRVFSEEHSGPVRAAFKHRSRPLEWDVSSTAPIRPIRKCPYTAPTTFCDTPFTI